MKHFQLLRLYNKQAPKGGSIHLSELFVFYDLFVFNFFINEALFP